MAKRFDDPKYDAAFDRCIDVMTQMLLKYGPQILAQKEKAPPVAMVQNEAGCSDSPDQTEKAA